MTFIKPGRRSTMITRRSFLTNASAFLLCAPAVVRAANLMPLCGIIFPPEALQFGFASRLYVYTHMRAITQLQNDGLSLHQIAGEFNRQGRWAAHDRSWDVHRVIGVLKQNKQIQIADAYLRAVRALSLPLGADIFANGMASRA